ncbi:hypothetical protein NVP1121O_027 [Vibrio phage 1.121.O._10N.286.46.C4]|nr:hypothetical protein NVP1121O_027 [Vibrio phage 1.121.O._10N.286.46.C4]
MEMFKGVALIDLGNGKYQLVIKINDVKEERLTLDESQLNYILSTFRQGA